MKVNDDDISAPPLLSFRFPHGGLLVFQQFLHIIGGRIKPPQGSPGMGAKPVEGAAFDDGDLQGLYPQQAFQILIIVVHVPEIDLQLFPENFLGHRLIHQGTRRDFRVEMEEGAVFRAVFLTGGPVRNRQTGQRYHRFDSVGGYPGKIGDIDDGGNPIDIFETGDSGAILVVVMGLSMMSQGTALSGMSSQINTLFSANGETAVKTSDRNDSDTDIEKDGIQYVSSTLESGHYPDITVKAGTPVKWTIHAEKSSINGCNYKILLPDFDTECVFEEGDNTIEFTPKKTGIYTYSCWMGMITGKIYVESE